MCHTPYSTMLKLCPLSWIWADVCACVHVSAWTYRCLLGRVCVLQREKKAGVLKCHITQHGNNAHDMRCVSPHHHRPLSMCRTGPQPSTCAEDMHEIYTGMSLYRSPRVGNATLITFFFSFFFCYAQCHHPSGCFCYCPYCLLFVVPASLKHRQLHEGQPWLLFYDLCESLCQR